MTDALRQGQTFPTINHARQYASQILKRPINPGTAEAKLVDESLEASLVRTARHLIEQGNDPLTTYQTLVTLYQNQPTLGVRSSTSVLQQAYSTPLPIAYLASVLLDIKPHHRIYEPTAGHGALLLTTSPENAIVNELNPERAEDLRAQGFIVTQNDASTYLPEQTFDTVILNPPFGTVPDNNGQNRRFQADRYATSQIDHAIALNALKAMKPDGQAVLILGGQLGKEDEKRSNRYNSKENRAFYYTLYQQYNVTRHFSIWGDLYRKQGAGFPIDLILINGQGKSSLSLPAVEVPPIYYSFEQLGELIHDLFSSKSPSLATTDSRTSISRPFAPQRDPNHQPKPLSESVGNAPQSPDSTLDEVYASQSTGNPSTALHRTLEPEYQSISASNDGSREMATELDTSHHSRQRHHSLSTGADGHRISSTRDNDQTADRKLSTPLFEPSRLRTEPRGMVNGTQQPTGFGHSSDGITQDEIGRDFDNNNKGQQAMKIIEQEVKETQDPTISNLPSAIENPTQAPYRPHSQGKSVNTLLPYNMQTATDQALSRLEQEIDSLDAYVADKLNYSSTSTLHRYFSAEQIDALALSIHNLEKGSGFIIGDQTGIGKGRIVAGMMRYARLIGKTPIFVTKDATLYADIMRDVHDIGMTHFRPFPTNSDLSLPLPDGRTLSTNAKSHKTEMAALQKARNLGHYHAIFTLYSQLQTVKGQETARRDFLRTFASNSILLLDESHEAGGDGQQKTNGAMNRAEFVRELVDLADGVVYSSATYAKRPNVMGLYRKTDMRLAVSQQESLESLMERGGVPLQQAVAIMLSDAGQYIRRERSFEGVEFSPDVVSVNQDTANNIALMMSKILEFDRFKQQSVKRMDKSLKEDAKALLGDAAIGQTGASSTNFTSIMHNVIDQMLLALKAEACVQKSLSLLRQETPEKPVIALSNTMGSLIQHFASQEALEIGDSLDIDFGDLLLRYLERSRDIITGDPYGKKERHRLTDAELGEEGVAEYEAVRTLIQNTDFSNIPVSPIDYLTHRLTQEGFKVGEITGREHILSYHSNEQGEWTTSYQKRTTQERSKANAVKQVNAFNSGQLDVLVLNRSGSTGISLHASEKFSDQKRRHMMILQPDRDINQFMQMLGRVHRTGQVIPPNFTLLMADIPAEKRPGAVLARKMASLNANTTAARSNGLSIDVPDFMNIYGSRVVTELMMSRPLLHYRLGEPLNNLQNEFETTKAIEKVTGRIPLLPLTEQEEVYRQIETNYQELIKEQEALGVSILEAKTLDLDAHVMSEVEVIPPDTSHSSPFTRSVTLQVVNAKTPRKPYSQLKTINLLHHALNLPEITTLDAHQLDDLQQIAEQHAQNQLQQLEQAIETYRRQNLHRHTTMTAVDTFNSRINEQYKILRDFLTVYPIGSPLEVTTDQGLTYTGVVGNLYSDSDPKGSPSAPSNWKMRLILADPIQELTLPFSRINSDKEGTLKIKPQTDEQRRQAIYQSFDEKQTINREIRQIFTGNLLRAYEAFQGRGHLVNYTDRQGNIRQGLLTPKEFDLNQTLEHQPVALPTVGDAYRFLTEIGTLMTSDQILALKRTKNGQFVMQTPKPKDSGGRYYLDRDILDAAGDEFYSISDRMECPFPEERLNQVLSTLIIEKGYTLASFFEQDKARKLLGLTLPTVTLPSSQDLEAMLPPHQRLEIAEGRGQIEGDKKIKTPVNLDAASLESENVSSQGLEIENETGRNEPESQITRKPDIAKPLTTDERLELQLPLMLSEEKEKDDRVNSQEEQPVTSLSSPILRSQDQKGNAAQNVVRLLEKSGLLEPLSKNEDFHLKIPNEPYIPLVIERQGEDIYFTHYLTQNGDMFIDSEMVFHLSSEGKFSLQETAVHSIGGEYRSCDNSYACIFSQNLHHQGFVEAAQNAYQNHVKQAAEKESTHKISDDETLETPSKAFIPPKEADNDNKAAHQQEDVTLIADIKPKQTTFTSLEGEQLKLCLIADNKAPPAPVSPSPEPNLPEVPQSDKSFQIDRETPEKPDNQKASQPDNTPAKEPENQQGRKPDNQIDTSSPSQGYNPKTDPDLKTLRSWYQAAQILGESQQTLDNIHRLARYVRQKHAAQNPVEMSSITQKRIKQDLEKLAAYRQLSKSIVSASKIILQSQGECKENGVTVFKGKTYGICYKKGNFAVYRLGGETPQPILKITEGVVKLATFNQRDVEAFQGYAQYVQEKTMMGHG